jgi:hypothetical protein
MSAQAKYAAFAPSVLRGVSMDEEDRRRERDAKALWYDTRDGLGRHNGLAHKIQSFLVPHGEIETLCGRSVFVAYPARVAVSERTWGCQIKCRRCEAEIASGRWVYP